MESFYFRRQLFIDENISDYFLFSSYNGWVEQVAVSEVFIFVPKSVFRDGRSCSWSLEKISARKICECQKKERKSGTNRPGGEEAYREIRFYLLRRSLLAKW